VVTRAKAQQPEGAGDWMEEELRDTRARLHKVESELDQALKHVWSLEADIRKLAEALSTSGSAATQLGGLREELRQVHDQLSRVQDRQSSIANRTDEALRQRQADSSRDKQDVMNLTRQIEALAKAADQYDVRVQALEEAFRHVEDEVASARLSGQGVDRGLEEVSGRAARALEATVRLEQEVAHAGGEIDTLRKTDEATEDRLSLLSEQTRRLSERIDKLEDIAAFPREAREMIQRLALVEKLSGEVAERMQEFVQGLARLEQRGQQQGAQLMDLSGQILELSDQTKAQLKRAYQLLLRQRKRQSDTLAQEIKELSQSEMHSGD
jgi:chromosome segregation ATPase